MRIFLVATVVLALGLGVLPAVAVDLAAPLPRPDAGFDWNRFYVGGHAVVGTGRGSGAGLDIGLTARLEVILTGAELAVETLQGAGLRASGTARAGLMLSDSFALYGAGGLVVPLTGSATPSLTTGGGLEAALAPSVSLDARYMHAIPLGTGAPSDQLSVGTRLHF